MLLLRFFSDTRPWPFLRATGSLWATTAATTSSLASLPVGLETARAARPPAPRILPRPSPPGAAQQRRGLGPARGRSTLHGSGRRRDLLPGGLRHDSPPGAAALARHGRGSRRRFRGRGDRRRHLPSGGHEQHDGEHHGRHGRRVSRCSVRGEAGMIRWPAANRRPATSRRLALNGELT